MEVKEYFDGLLYTQAHYSHREYETLLCRCGDRSQYSAVELLHRRCYQEVGQRYEQASDT